MKEILSDDEKQQKSQMAAQKASKESASPSKGQPSSQGEESGAIPGELDLQDPVDEGGEEAAVKEVTFTKLNTKDSVLMKALMEARDKCYEEDNLSAQKVWGAVMGLDNIPTAVQIHKREFFKLGSQGNCMVDDIHSHWEPYLHKYGVLANAPYSQFHPKEGWDAVYTWESLEKHEPMLTNTYGKKAAKPSLMVVVAPTTTEIGNDYFLNKLHKAACTKRKSVYFGHKVSGKRSRMQVVICSYCGVLSQNTPAIWSHIRRHLGLTSACRACRKFRHETPKKLQEHLGKCKEVLAAEVAADFAASQSRTSKEEKA